MQKKTLYCFNNAKSIKRHFSIFKQISIENCPKVWTLEIFIDLTRVDNLWWRSLTHGYSKGYVVIRNGYEFKFGTAMDLCRREYSTNNCFRRCMLTFLTYYSVGIHPRHDPRIGRSVPNDEIRYVIFKIAY